MLCFKIYFLDVQNFRYFYLEKSFKFEDFLLLNLNMVLNVLFCNILAGAMNSNQIWLLSQWTREYFPQ